MNKLAAIPLVTMIALASAITGCSTTQATPTTADRMRGYADDQQVEVEKKNEIAKDWDRGQQMVESGRDDLKQGQAKVDAAEKQLREGQEQITRGNRQVEEGTALTQDSLQRFRVEFPGLELAPGV